MKIAVFTSPTRNDGEIKNEVIQAFEKSGFILDDDNPDVVIYIGGDGTFLRAVTHYFDKLDSVKFYGICIGTLGYFYDYRLNQLQEAIDTLKNQDTIIETNAILEADIEYENINEKLYGINEIRVENPFHTLICDVFVNDKYLETYRGNGLLIASSLGSSAYNKSLGGALLPHSENLFELTEIVPIHNNAFNSLGSSLVLTRNDHVILKGDFQQAVVGFDFSTSKNTSLKKMDIYLSHKFVAVIHPKSYSYIDNIKKSFIK